MAEQEKKSDQVVAVTDGPDHGYIGQVQDDTPNEDYTVTGVTRTRDDRPSTGGEQPPLRTTRRNTKS
jgi:ribosomal protein L24